MSVLSPDDFPAFFQEVHQHIPFPWQRRLAARVAESGRWPTTLDLPTGTGKTAAIDIAVFHLALEADRGAARRAPARIAFVVDRRLVVDDAFTRAGRIAATLAAAAPDTVAGRVARQLRSLAEAPERPLIALRLRGGIPREDDWARTPSQPTVLCSTVDQVGSRLLFRGYGLADTVKPIHAGLIGADCLILLDEAHLAEPFRQTLGWIDTYRGESWRENASVSPWGFSLITATPGQSAGDRFALDAADHDNPDLRARLDASKLARLIRIRAGKTQGGSVDEAAEAGEGEPGLRHRIDTLVGEVRKAMDRLADRFAPSHPAIGVVVNRVARARQVFERLRDDLGDAVELILLIGPSRPLDREEVSLQLAPVRTGSPRDLQKPLVIVATQCIEAGVDIDLDGLVTELAPIDALRQRLGRLNRAGRVVEAFATIVADSRDLGARHDDPVYGTTLRSAWGYLNAISSPPSKKSEPPTLDFGLSRMTERILSNTAEEQSLYEQAISPRPDAPVLLPAHLDLLSHTSPVPSADPEVALYLHGPRRAAASVTVVWRADVDPGQMQPVEVRRLLALMPPRSTETVELPLWAVRSWLDGEVATRGDDPLSDIAEMPPDGSAARSRKARKGRIFRWVGEDDRSLWIEPAEIRAGDTLIVPASYGGLDEFGWKPESDAPAVDVADRAAEPFAGRRFVVRVAPGILTEPIEGESYGERVLRERAKAAALAEALAAAGSGWRAVRDAALTVGLSAMLVKLLGRLERARRRNGRSRVEAAFDVYGDDELGRPRGVVLVATQGVDDGPVRDESAPAGTEDDVAGSLASVSIPLTSHCDDVGARARVFARTVGLPESAVADLALAGYLHDLGKADPRFQRWLHFGDPLGADPADPESVLAKSGRALPPVARGRSGLPDRWRHEALSVRLALADPRFAQAHDRNLVLWLIGTHHGHGRPLYPHADPWDARDRDDLPLPLKAGFGPQSLAFDHDGLDWPQLYELLKARYGVWELARMEAILRLADHRASEDAERAAAGEGPRGEVAP